jgi:serine/threonine protein kinase
MGDYAWLPAALAAPGGEGCLNSASCTPERMKGAGASGSVFEIGPACGGKPVAVKKFARGPLQLNPQANHSFQKEVMLFSKLEHPNVIRLLGVRHEPSCHLLIMELADGDMLGEMNRGALPEEEARAYFRQVVAAVQHCHSRGVCHRDLKLDNIMLMRDGVTVKVTDFGLGKDWQIHSAPKSQVGTLYYMAPETLSGRVSCYLPSPVDVWSLGVIMYVLCRCTYPFGPYGSTASVQEQRDIRLRILDADTLVQSPRFFPPGGGQLSAELQALLRSILIVDPSSRIDINALQAHPYFNAPDPDWFTPQVVEPQAALPVADATPPEVQMTTSVGPDQLLPVGGATAEGEAAAAAPPLDFAWSGPATVDFSALPELCIDGSRDGLMVFDDVDSGDDMDFQ